MLLISGWHLLVEEILPRLLTAVPSCCYGGVLPTSAASRTAPAPGGTQTRKQNSPMCWAGTDLGPDLGWMLGTAAIYCSIHHIILGI